MCPAAENDALLCVVLLFLLVVVVIGGSTGFKTDNGRRETAGIGLDSEMDNRSIFDVEEPYSEEVVEKLTDGSFEADTDEKSEESADFETE